jgi:hypothetical protein
MLLLESRILHLLITKSPGPAGKPLYEAIYLTPDHRLIHFICTGPTCKERKEISQHFMGDQRQWVKEALLPDWYHACQQ